MNTTGTASHCKRNALTMAITNKIILGRLFLTVKSLNFNAINGKVEIINKLNTSISKYKNHLFISILKTSSD